MSDLEIRKYEIRKKKRISIDNIIRYLNLLYDKENLENFTLEFIENIENKLKLKLYGKIYD